MSVQIGGCSSWVSFRGRGSVRGGGGPLSVLRGSSPLVLLGLGQLDQRVDGVQQVVAVLPQETLVEPLVSEAHLQ